VPLEFQSVVAARVHGLACWFDVLFDGSTAQRWLSTAPGAPTTHWYQLRCVLSQPLYVLAGQPITGRLHLVAHSSQSYTIHLTMSGGVRGGVLQTSTAKLDLKEPYYRMSQSPAYAWTQQDQASQYREETIAQQQVSSLIQLFRS
jgi:histone-arginine methyltransferase CARM1